MTKIRDYEVVLVFPSGETVTRHTRAKTARLAQHDVANRFYFEERPDSEERATEVRSSVLKRYVTEAEKAERRIARLSPSLPPGTTRG
jgi:hypothetical protein